MDAIHLYTDSDHGQVLCGALENHTWRRFKVQNGEFVPREDFWPAGRWFDIEGDLPEYQRRVFIEKHLGATGVVFWVSLHLFTQPLLSVLCESSYSFPIRYYDRWPYFREDDADRIRPNNCEFFQQRWEKFHHAVCQMIENDPGCESFLLHELDRVDRN